MRTSDLIKLLQEDLNKNGDKQLVAYDGVNAVRNVESVELHSSSVCCEIVIKH